VSSAAALPTGDRARAVRALQRLRTDFTAWSARCFHILDKEKQRRRLVPNAAQLAVMAEEERQMAARGYARLFTLKGRQGGITTYEQARALHLASYVKRGATALTLAHDRDSTDKIFDKITSYALSHFPPALLPTLGAAQTREVTFPGRESQFYTGTAGAGRTGRGLTINRFHGSEFAFWDDPITILGAITPALVPNGSVVNLESTASAFDSDAHNFWREAAARGYAQVFLPWWVCDPVHYRLPLLAPDELGKPEPDEQALAAGHGLTLEQLKWRRAKMAEMGRERFLQEYAEDPESCWLTAGGNFYDVGLLKLLLSKAPESTREHLGGALRLYAEIPGEAPGGRRGVGPRTERVIIGADTAEGVGGDRSTFVARAFPSWRQLAMYEDAQVTPREFAAILDSWGRRLGGSAGPALLVVEKNMHGITTLRHLRDDHQYPPEFIYHRASLDEEHHGAELDSGRIGWHTSGESQPLMLDAGRELLLAARDGYASVPSASAIRDAFKVRRDKSGRIKLTGCDVLVAETLAWLGRSYPVYEPMIGRA
jgi:hypothetical protein